MINQDPKHRFLREVSLYVSGTGWRAYDNIVGQPIYYPGYSEHIKNSVMSTPLLQDRISRLAEMRLEVEEKEGWLRSDDENFQVKRSQRRSALEAGLREIAEKWTNDMICKFESKTFIRGAYYLVTQLITRAYNQGPSLISTPLGFLLPTSVGRLLMLIYDHRHSCF